jgi:excisionase family DNA binding protein
MELSVREAAERLGVDDSRVRQLIAADLLGARRVGRAWLVSDEDVRRLSRRRPGPGRPMAPARAWALLDLLDGGSAPWLSPVARSQVRELLRRLDGADADRWRSALRSRGEVHRVDAHPAALRRLDEDPAVHAAGPKRAAAAGADLVAIDPVREVYVPADEWPRLHRRLALREAEGSGNLLVRVPAQVWPWPDDAPVGRAALAADLLDSDEPRAVRAGVQVLNELAERHAGNRVR